MKESEVSREQFIIAISVYTGFKYGYRGCFPWKADTIKGCVIPERIKVTLSSTPIEGDGPISFPSSPTGSSFDGKEVCLSKKEVLHALSILLAEKNHGTYKGNIVEEITTFSVPPVIKFTLCFAVNYKKESAA